MSWEKVKLGELTVKAKTINPAEKIPKKLFNYVDISSINATSKKITDPKKIIGKDSPSRARQILENKDIVVSTVRPNLNAVAIHSSTEEISIASTGFCIIRAKKHLLNYRYAFYWFQTNDFISRLVDKASGASYPAVSDTIIKNEGIPLPPLETQQQIAAILDKADALRKKDRQLLSHCDELLQSIFYDMFGDPVKNEKGWEVKALGDCSCKIQIGPFGTQLHAEDYIAGGIPLINPMHIIEGQIKENISFTISNDKYDELRNYHLKDNDIIMGRRGEMGRCAIVSTRESGWLCGTGSLYIRPAEGFHSFFLQKILSSETIKKYYENVSQGVTMANLNKKIVSSTPIISPPISLQNQFASIAQNINHQKQQVKQQMMQSENLFNSLLQRAFKGQLVS